MNTKNYLKLLPVIALLLCGIFSVRGQIPMYPGGINDTNTPGFKWVGWFSPEPELYRKDVPISPSYTPRAMWVNRVDTLFAGLGSFVSDLPGDLARYLTGTTPPGIVPGFNYHRALQFVTTAYTVAPNQMETFGALIVTANDAFTFFIVAKKDSSRNGNRDFLFGYGTVGNTTGGIWWESAYTNTNIHMGWTTTDRNLGSAPSGIIVIDNPNVTVTAGNTNGLRAYSNGTPRTPTANTQGRMPGLLAAMQDTSSIRIGASHYDYNGQYGLNGKISEVIIAKRTGGAAIADSCLQRVQSYLAVKYGITLDTTRYDYQASNGTIIWSRLTNTGYNNDIFGIGIDANTGLNQAQSCSSNNDMITVYKGPLNQYNDYASTAFYVPTPPWPISLPADRTYLMFGSNGSAGSTVYNQPPNTSFENGSNGDNKLTFRYNRVFKAQNTYGSSNAAAIALLQTVNIKVNAKNVRYVLVSANASFVPGSTRIYPVDNNNTATGVIVNSGDYIALAGFEASPGGVPMGGNYTLDLWVDGNHSTDASWPNLTEDAVYSLEKISPTASAPVVRNSVFNYHKELNFGNVASSKLRTTANFQLTNTNSYHMFVVSDARASAADAVLLTFANSATGSNLRWNSSATNILSSYWATTHRQPGFTAANYPRYGIATINTTSQSNNAFHIYLNGTRSIITLTGTPPNLTGNRLLVGNASTTATGTAAAFNGAIQEIILMRKPGNPNALMPDVDIAKIHSYLALKYSFTLNSGNYLNSSGDTIWNRWTNTGFNKYIFGIGRDDASGLYQKQSKPENNAAFAVFIGDTLATLNSDNNGTLADKQYLILGTADTLYRPISGLWPAIVHLTPYANGNLSTTVDLNIQSANYKVQLTPTPAMAGMTVKFKVSSNNFTHLLVSSSPYFTTGNPGPTRQYPLNGQSFIEVTLEDGEYIKFIGNDPGPGGVSGGLKLWLRADDEGAITPTYLTRSDTRLTGYPGTVSDTANIPGVWEWNDFVREQTYSYTAAATGNRIPVLESYSPEMNYYPAVRFWNDGTNATTAYLANSKGIMETGMGRPLGHTAIFMVNNGFTQTRNWSYNMMFGSTTLGGSAAHNGPGYAIQRLNDGTTANPIYRMVGRLRPGSPAAESYVITGQLDLFRAGATSILGYLTTLSGTANNSTASVIFRFNGTEDPLGAPNNIDDGFNMNAVSTIGVGYNYERATVGVMSEAIIFDRILDAHERIRVDSYLALKYGVTLRPENTLTHRYTYLFSDSTVVWPGDQTTDDRFIKYYNNVAAVIRDDAARLNNRHSHSTDAGSILHMGVAGTLLSADGSNVGSLNNLEAVAFGCDTVTSLIQVPEEDDCMFTHRFGRVWLIHKVAKDSIQLLIGAQDNSGLSIGGFDQNLIANYYQHLNAGYDVTMLVADSANGFANGKYQPVHMQYRNGEHQCSYLFTNENTYITFGFKPNNKGCVGDEEHVFVGTKTFAWNDWTSRVNRSSTGTGLTLSLPSVTPSIPLLQGNLGDGIFVTKTTVSYPGGTYPGTGVRATLGYPHSVNSPQRGSLEVRRRGGRGDVTIQIDFNTPIYKPGFMIAAIDGSSSGWEEVEIYGICRNSDGTPGSTEYPSSLGYRTTPGNSNYTILGRRATVTRSRTATATNTSGQLNVTFSSGVSSIIIKYRVNRSSTTRRRIFVGPITFEAVPPPTPINKYGWGFTKHVTLPSDSGRTFFYTCEEVPYSFEIANEDKGCNPRQVNFCDTLPENMYWVVNRFGLDGKSADLNPNFKPEILPIDGVGRILKIDSLMVPGGDDSPLRLTATAKFNANATDGTYENRAYMVYDNPDEPGTDFIHGSVDIYTLLPFTTLDAVYVVSPVPIEYTEWYSRDTYKENQEIDVSYTITNDNQSITDVFMDIFFTDSFKYVNGSLQFVMLDGTFESPPPVRVIFSDPDDNIGMLRIAGSGDEDDDIGFVLPTGTLQIKFKLLAPAVAPPDADDPEEKETLVIEYGIYSQMEDPCLGPIVTHDDHKEIPYRKSPTHIITNRNVTMGIQK